MWARAEVRGLTGQGWPADLQNAAEGDGPGSPSLPSAAIMEFGSGEGAARGGQSLSLRVAQDDGPAIAYRIGADGWLSASSAGDGTLGTKGPRGDFRLDGAVALAGTDGLLVVAETGSAGLASYRVGGRGLLDKVDAVGAETGLGIAAPAALELAHAHGRTWAVLAAEGSGSLTVMELKPGGRLIPVDQLIDTADTSFAGADRLSVETVRGQSFVTVSGSEGGSSLFTLLPDGRLVHLESTGGNAAAAPGLSDLDLSDLGRVRDGTGDPGRDKIKGGGKDDLLIAGEGRDVLTGRGGDDILVAGDGRGTLKGQKGADLLVSGDGDAGGKGTKMFGGAGADTFVLAPVAKGCHVIADFEAGIDRLDLSAALGLMDPDQLVIKGRAWGAMIKLDGTKVKVRGDDGPFDAEDLFAGAEGLGTALRVPLPDMGDGLF